MNISYQANANSQSYLFFRKGFNTNNARVVVKENCKQTLPAAYGMGVSMMYKPRITRNKPYKFYRGKGFDFKSLYYFAQLDGFGNGY